MLSKVVTHWENCKDPHLIRNKYTGELIHVPCGHCTACMSRKITSNVSLILRESSCWKYVFFFTLTYSDYFLPKINLYSYVPEKNYKRSYENYYNLSFDYIEFCKGLLPVCSVNDVQKFIKRLRENIFRQFGLRSAFRYFMSFDYGSTTFRPHYHGLLFTGSSQVADNIDSLLHQAWSVRSSSGQKKSLGIIDVQHSYAAARYVSTYIQLSDKRPTIYNYRAFRVRSFHSSHPSLGSLVRTLETPQQIIDGRLSDVTMYDPATYSWKKFPLRPSDVRRFFPRLPSFNRIDSKERHELYRIFSRCLDLSREERLNYLYSVISVNSFFKDYITLGSKTLDSSYFDRKFDCCFYIFKRFHYQCSIYEMSYSEYDNVVFEFNQKLLFNALTKQFEFEKSLNGSKFTDSLVDHARNGNKRSVPGFVDNVDVPVSPRPVDTEYFLYTDNLYQKLIKRKCDNAYLERRPEFKQFHL